MRYAAMTKPTATLYRMVLPTHTCPYGVSARELLEEAGFEIDEHILGSREEVDAFQAEHDVSTTPQIFIDGERIGAATISRPISRSHPIIGHARPS